MGQMEEVVGRIFGLSGERVRRDLEDIRQEGEMDEVSDQAKQEDLDCSGRESPSGFLHGIKGVKMLRAGFEEHTG